jgi:lambda family phage portal protein
MLKKLAAKIFRKEIADIAASAASAVLTGRNPGYSGGVSGGSKWPSGLSASGAVRVLDHSRLRRNAREAFHDTPEARALVERYADTVGDVGLRIECAPKNTILGITLEEAEKWSSDVEARFDCWAKDKKQNRSETMNWYQSHRLYQIFQHRDNDIFSRLYYSPDRQLLNPLQFEFIDPDQIRGDAYSFTYGPNGLPDDGIERDARGREKKYKIWVKKPDGQYKKVDIPAVGPKSGRRFMLHGFSPEYAGQGRGYSRLSHAIQDFENLTDFSSAHIKKAINHSMITMFVKPSPDNPASNPFEDILTNRGAGPASQQFGSNPEPVQNDTGITQPVNYCPIPEATFGTPGSVGVFNLTEGEDLKPFESKAPAESYDRFVDAFTSHLSASTGMPVEVLLMKFGQNYSASRATLILFWRIVQVWRDEMAADYLNPVFEMWLSGEIASGRISAPGWSDPILKAAWINCNWIGSPMPNIDPKRTAEADKTYVEMGAQTLDRVARNLNGSSGPANRAKLTREFKELPDSPWNIKIQGPPNG